MAEHTHEHKIVDPATIINGEQYAENPIVISKEYKFSFREITTKVSEEVDGEIKEIENKSRRAPVTLLLPLPTIEGLKIALADPKQVDFILSLLAEEVKAAARDQVDEDATFTHQSQLDISKLTIKALSEVTPASRRGGGIPKESWEEFTKDYNAIMPGVTGKSETNVANASKMFAARLQPAKGNKAVLKVLEAQLTLWGASTKKLEELMAVYEFLEAKLADFLKMDDADLTANL